MSANPGALWNRWEEIDGLLARVLELPPEDRLAAIRAAAGDDLELAETVARLLGRASDDRSLSVPSGTFVEGAFAEPEAVVPGDRIGRYRIVSQLGRGGMATVYLAERADGTYEQRVALKVLRRGLDTDDLIARFVSERQILSSLSHPNIARLLDGGSTGDGRPFLVMELVEGEQIVTWADSRCLPVPERLRLFLSVADAVHAAHRQLVVHRDIKPSNVMVDATGQVKLLDFGIAKLLDADGAFTDAGRTPHTPRYASPEQLSGARITTASDVYQVGILLLELVTGVRHTHDGGAPTARPASHAVLSEDEPSQSPAARAASRSSTPQQLVRRLRGDVDMIIAKALRDDPAERYASVAEMAEDVRRHLAGRPIVAHGESLGYRTRKFVGRHPGFLPAMALGVALLVGYVVTLNRHNAALARERDAAAASSDLATATRDFLVDMFRTADPFGPTDVERGRSMTVLEALRLGNQQLDDDLMSQPQLRAALLTTIGEVFQNLEQAEEAVATLQRARRARAELGDTASGEYQRILEVLGSAYLTMGEPDSATRVLEQVLELARAQQPPDPARLSAALIANAILRSAASPADAVPFNEEAVIAAREVGGTTLGEALRKLADTYRSAGRLADSEVAAREALAIFRRVEGDSTVRTGFALHSLGQTLGERRNFTEAAPLLNWSLAVLDRRLGRRNDYTMQMRNNLAVYFTMAGDFEMAVELLRELLADQVGKYGADSPLLASSHQNLAAGLIRLGRLDEADASAARAQQLYAANPQAGAHMVAFPLLTRTELALTQGDHAAGLRLAQQAAAALRGRVSELHPAAIMADCRMGRAHAGLGRLTEARVMLDSALQRLQRLPSSSEQHIAECRRASEGLGADR